MTSAVDSLVSILDLEPLEVNLFRGKSPQDGWQRVFGGQVIGQALVAACRRGLTGRKATLELDGGDLTIEWRESDGHVIMTGPVETEFAGRL